MARLVVIAPGRGSYNRSELNYFQRFKDHPNYSERKSILKMADDLRKENGRSPISELDGAPAFRTSLHLPGENASPLIFSASAADFLTLSEAHEVVAVLGNSMGWYTTLFTGGALAFDQAFRLMDTMGSFQKGNIQGGQLIIPVVNDSWQRDEALEQLVLEKLREVSQRGPDTWVDLSIRLGGFLVLAGTQLGINALLEELPQIKLRATDYPFQLPRHAAFHTPMMQAASDHGLSETAGLVWGTPNIPMIDGRGAIWRAHNTSTEALKNYTLVDQVVKPYDFTLSLRVAIREYNPDHLVLLGPGESLGGAIAHTIIAEKWRGIDSKKSFVEAQRQDRPPLISFTRPEQAALVI